jgi:broad specificity phosphatase PhoE
MPPTRFIILIRHSTVNIDQSHSAQDWVLSADGRARCELLAKKLIPFEPALFITSQEQKAVETGRLMAEILNLSHKNAPGLQEHDRLGVPYFESAQAFSEMVSNFFANPEDLVFGRETAVQAQNRFRQAIYREMDLAHTGNLAFITHGTVMTLFVCHHNSQLDPIKFWNSLELPCAVILNFPGYIFRTRILL